MGHGIQKRKRQLTPMYVFDIPSDWPQPLPIDQEIVMSLSNLDNGLKATVEPDPDNHPRSFGRVTITRVKNRNKFKVLRIERGDAIHWQFMQKCQADGYFPPNAFSYGGSTAKYEIDEDIPTSPEVQAYMERIARQHLKATSRDINKGYCIGVDANGNPTTVEAVNEEPIMIAEYADVEPNTEGIDKELTNIRKATKEEVDDMIKHMS